MARVIFKFKDRILGVYPLQPKRSITIGRRPGNDIVIDNLAVSGHHASQGRRGVLIQTSTPCTRCSVKSMS